MMKEEWSHYVFFFFNDTATTEIYTLSLHDALPIYHIKLQYCLKNFINGRMSHQTVLILHISYGTLFIKLLQKQMRHFKLRSEEHTSELQSRQYLVCRLLLEKKNKIPTSSPRTYHSV